MHRESDTLCASVFFSFYLYQLSHFRAEQLQHKTVHEETLIWDNLFSRWLSYYIIRVAERYKFWKLEVSQALANKR